MKVLLFKIYSFLFARSFFYRFNRFLYLASLRSMGMLNSWSSYWSGEKGWVSSYLTKLKEPVVFDIGANIGMYSIMVKNANSNAKVYAFEPHPITFKSLKENLKPYGCECVNVAVGEEQGSLELYDYASNDGSSHASLYKEVIEGLLNQDSVSHTVDVISIKDFLEEKKIDSIDLLKIDTEGNELKILSACKHLFASKKVKAIHFEITITNIISRSSFKDFWDLLSAYNLYRMLPGGKLLQIKNYEPIFCEIYAYQNIVALLK